MLIHGGEAASVSPGMAARVKARRIVLCAAHPQMAEPDTNGLDPAIHVYPPDRVRAWRRM